MATTGSRERSFQPAPFISARIVLALGYYALPDLDQISTSTTRGATSPSRTGVRRFLPDVVIEHIDPFAGRAEWDAGYERVNAEAAVREDRLRYESWREHAMPTDVGRVRAALADDAPPYPDLDVRSRGGPPRRAGARRRRPGGRDLPRALGRGDGRDGAGRPHGRTRPGRSPRGRRGDRPASTSTNLVDDGVADRVVAHVGRLEPILPVLRPRAFGFAFLDAYHTTEAVARDLALILPLMTPGSLVASTTTATSGSASPPRSTSTARWSS